MQNAVELTWIQTQVPAYRRLFFLIQVEADEHRAIALRFHFPDGDLQICGHLLFLDFGLCGRGSDPFAIELLEARAAFRAFSDQAALIEAQLHRDLEDVAGDLLRLLDFTRAPLLPCNTARVMQQIGGYLGVADASREQPLQARVVLLDKLANVGAVQLALILVIGHLPVHDTLARYSSCVQHRDMLHGAQVVTLEQRAVILAVSPDDTVRRPMCRHTRPLFFPDR
jgi:hypothetical protein